MLPAYDEPVKCAARRRVLGHAVSVLTGKSGSGPILAPARVRQVAHEAACELAKCTRGRFDGLPPAMKDVVDHWAQGHEVRAAPRTPSDLWVLILAGPKPSNDIQELVALGVDPAHVVAIERDRAIYEAAQQDLADNRFPAQLVHGSLVDFLRSTEQRFDILYFDGCGPFMGGHPNTLAPMLEMFVHERLAERCVLISNYSQVPSTDEQTRRFAALCSSYFAPRRRDIPSCIYEAGYDPEIVQYEPETLMPLAISRMPDFYGDFITRFTIDICRYIIPACRSFASENGARWMLAKPIADVDAAVGSIFRRKTTIANATGITDTGQSFESWFQDALTRHTWELCPSSYPLYGFLTESPRLVGNEPDPVGAVFRDYSINRTPIRGLLPYVFTLDALYEGHWDVASELLQRIALLTWFDQDVGVFCDKPMPRLLIHGLMGKQGHPYHPVASDCLRFRYRARVQEMYTDCLVLDQCRAFYDFLPEPEVLVHGWHQDVRPQLLARAMIDLMNWQDWESSTHPFHAGALFGSGDRPWSKASSYPERFVLTP